MAVACGGGVSSAAAVCETRRNMAGMAAKPARRSKAAWRQPAGEIIASWRRAAGVCQRISHGGGMLSCLVGAHQCNAEYQWRIQPGIGVAVKSGRPVIREISMAYWLGWRGVMAA